jgi:hypothetical protein
LLLFSSVLLPISDDWQQQVVVFPSSTFSLFILPSSFLFIIPSFSLIILLSSLSQHSPLPTSVPDLISSVQLYQQAKSYFQMRLAVSSIC